MVCDLLEVSTSGYIAHQHRRGADTMQAHMQSSLVTDALRMAWFRRAPEPGLVSHSDRGSPLLRARFSVGAQGLQDEKLDEPQG
jgi:transposase InsO family protein